MGNSRYVRSIQHFMLLTLCSIQSIYYRVPFKMSPKSLFRLATYSGISIGSFFTGIAYERNRFNNKLDQTDDPYILYARNDIRNVSLILRKVKSNCLKCVVLMSSNYRDIVDCIARIAHFWQCISG